MEQYSKLSKLLSYYLRHNPSDLNLNMDTGGWVKIDEIIENSQGKFSRDILECIVETDNKKRYTISKDGKYIRANQGHSLDWVNVELEEVAPLDVLYHGTCEKYAKLIDESGIKKMNRNYVHLSSNIETAKNVGNRHAHGKDNKLVVYEVNSKKMSSDGYKFYISENGVWLTEYIPTQYIKRISIN